MNRATLYQGYRANTRKAVYHSVHRFPEVPGTQLINLGRIKGWVDHGATQWFQTRDPWIENSASSQLGHCVFNLSPWDVEIISTYFSVWLWNVKINFLKFAAFRGFNFKNLLHRNSIIRTGLGKSFSLCRLLVLKIETLNYKTKLQHAGFCLLREWWGVPPPPLAKSLFIPLHPH